MATNFAAATGAGGPVPLRDPWEGCAGSPWIFFLVVCFVVYFDTNQRYLKGTDLFFLGKVAVLGFFFA